MDKKIFKDSCNNILTDYMQDNDLKDIRKGELDALGELVISEFKYLARENHYEPNVLYINHNSDSEDDILLKLVYTRNDYKDKIQDQYRMDSDEDILDKVEKFAKYVDNHLSDEILDEISEIFTCNLNDEIFKD